jgi:hypothetical protein
MLENTKLRRFASIKECQLLDNLDNLIIWDAVRNLKICSRMLLGRFVSKCQGLIGAVKRASVLSRVAAEARGAG